MAVVRIELVRCGLDGQILSIPPDVGQGVLVSHDGLVLTASHVLLPLEGSLVGVGSFHLDIYRWQPNTGWSQTPFQTINSWDLATNSLFHTNLSVKFYFPGVGLKPIPCVANYPSFDKTEEDVAVLHIRSNAQCPFLDLVGPDDAIDSDSVGAYAGDFYIASDFDFTEPPEHVQVENIPGKDTREFVTTEAREFNKGVSGSPLIVYIQYPTKAVFVGGIVVQSPPPKAAGCCNSWFIERFFGCRKGTFH